MSRFASALRLPEIRLGQTILKRPDWRTKLAQLACREPSSQHFPANEKPAEEDASRVLSETFAKHPMANVSARLSGGAVERDIPKAVQALVIAEVVLRPELAPVPPGGEFPDIADEVLTGAYVVHAALWPHTAGSADERAAARAVLQEIIENLPDALWLADD
jgi:hypothetical protein